MTAAGRRTLALRLLGVVAGVALGAAGMLAWNGPVELPAGASMFLAGAVIGELLPFRQPHGATPPMSLAVIGAMALIGTPPQVLAAFAGLAWVLAAVIQSASKSAVDVVDLPRRVLGGWTLSAVAILTSSIPMPEWVVTTPASLEGTADAPGLNALAAVAVGAVIIFGVPLTEAVMVRTRVNVPMRLRVLDAFRSTWQATTAIAATAALGAMVDPVLGAWTVPLMLAPLFAARFGLLRHWVVADAYDQTIRAMSRLPEQLGTLPPGHGVRVGRLAAAVSNELGLPDRELATIERAAHLHQIGRVPLEDDEPGPTEIAETGAGIVREAGDLDEVAEILMAMGNLAELGARRDLTARGARIVWACSVLDRFAPDFSDLGQVNEVLVRLVREVADIEIVAALARVTDPQGQPVPTA